jgi:hypothetical protein
MKPPRFSLKTLFVVITAFAIEAALFVLLPALGLIVAIVFVLGILAWTASLVFSSKCLLLQISYPIVCLIAFAAADISTFHCDYFQNANTHVFGWPMPQVIYQRDDANSPWLDYVGTITMLALPLNAIIFLFPPSLGFLAVGLVVSSKKRISNID